MVLDNFDRMENFDYYYPKNNFNKIAIDLETIQKDGIQ